MAQTLERSELERIAREGIKQVRARDVVVPRSLEREIKQAAATTPSFKLGSYGRTNTCKCLIGEVRHRRGEDPCPSTISRADRDFVMRYAESELGDLYDYMVCDAVEPDRYGAVVHIVDSA